ncbi:MlaE family lipid ABC transporter permease subunit [Sphingomonas sediminicola]|jgi:phospholipid/cholesterol/gamma-HCH transport system permease protein|uniref:MlaE family lipid ABC transporter permease subunit n=1 Tax=Sphingomonas sediminicola TaxID=386874 RepID=A0ABX6T609_9SPHN|nr:MlaE family lipid ABC transporter permease subunit [Sphingomonas sediminicola]QNP45272.1 MlaE family lipid ABC transporter permease subunit [Sphingomonas sediminicola]
MAATAASTAEGGNPPFRIRGTLTITRAASIQREIDAESDPLTIDLSGVERMDTVGAWLVYRAVRDRGAKVAGATPESQSLLDQVAEFDRPVQVHPDEKSSVTRVIAELGEWIAETGRTLVGLLGFFGATLVAMANLVSRPKRFRWNAVIQRFDVVGVRALGIIGLMSFLIGVVIGQQGAVQLQQFGAEVYTINLIGRITVRELGTLMTAIMVAGRSGSAFAAQLGTMKITEEIDAMRTIGVSPVEALVIPRLIAAVIMMPLLAFWAMLMSLLGGGIFVWLDLGIPPLTYIQRLQEVIPLTDLWIGLIKAPVFGFIIALAGCFQGMLVESNSEEVGLRTTTAVVQSIFLVIVLDAVFAVFFSSVGWI